MKKKIIYMYCIDFKVELGRFPLRPQSIYFTSFTVLKLDAQ